MNNIYHIILNYVNSDEISPSYTLDCAKKT